MRPIRFIHFDKNYEYVFKTLFYFIILINPFLSNAKTKKQLDYAKFVLEKNVINKTFTFGKWTQEGGTENQFTYLGKFKTKNSKIYKVLNSVWIWGVSGRATSRILIYDNHNNYLGNYYLQTMSDLPDKLVKNRLIFNNVEKYCEKENKPKIDLSYGLPKELLIKCNDKSAYVGVFE